MSIGMNGVMTCFQCKWGEYSKFDTGLLVSSCQNPAVDPEVLKRFDEKFLPLKCGGHFEYRDKKCSVCGRNIEQPLFVCVDDDPRGLIPICGLPCCAAAVEAMIVVIDEPQDDLSQLNCMVSAASQKCLFCGYTGGKLEGNFCSDRCANAFSEAWSPSINTKINHEAQ